MAGQASLDPLTCSAGCPHTMQPSCVMSLGAGGAVLCLPPGGTGQSLSGTAFCLHHRELFRFLHYSVLKMFTHCLLMHTVVPLCGCCGHGPAVSFQGIWCSALAGDAAWGCPLLLCMRGCCVTFPLWWGGCAHSCDPRTLGTSMLVHYSVTEEDKELVQRQTTGKQQSSLAGHRGRHTHYLRPRKVPQGSRRLGQPG
jgi:hypothetical protein